MPPDVFWGASLPLHRLVNAAIRVRARERKPQNESHAVNQVDILTATFARKSCLICLAV